MIKTRTEIVNALTKYVKQVRTLVATTKYYNEIACQVFNLAPVSKAPSSDFLHGEIYFQMIASLQRKIVTKLSSYCYRNCNSSISHMLHYHLGLNKIRRRGIAVGCFLSAQSAVSFQYFVVATLLAVEIQLLRTNFYFRENHPYEVCEVISLPVSIYKLIIIQYNV